MTYIDEVKANVPERIKIYPEYKVLLELIQAHNITSKDDFEAYMKVRNKQLQDFIDRNKERPTVVSQSRAKAQEIDLHKRIKLSFWRYL
ncbi:hypothetical protein HY641_04810 [Candidatus Woesearchaeota archaeon]|nr:hypothetical protein [Candidatus Woesearchaeota archaeon]